MTNPETLRVVAKRHLNTMHQKNLEILLEDPLDFEVAQAFVLREIDHKFDTREITAVEAMEAYKELAMSERAMMRARRPRS